MITQRLLWDSSVLQITDIHKFGTELRQALWIDQDPAPATCAFHVRRIKKVTRKVQNQILVLLGDPVPDLNRWSKQLLHLAGSIITQLP
jgi:hypothetical protein